MPYSGLSVSAPAKRFSTSAGYAVSGYSTRAKLCTHPLLMPATGSGEVETRGWESFFYDEWRLVWYRYAPGHDAGFDRLAVFVRADMPDEG